MLEVPVVEEVMVMEDINVKIWEDNNIKAASAVVTLEIFNPIAVACECDLKSQQIHHHNIQAYTYQEVEFRVILHMSLATHTVGLGRR